LAISFGIGLETKQGTFENRLSILAHWLLREVDNTSGNRKPGGHIGWKMVKGVHARDICSNCRQHRSNDSGQAVENFIISLSGEWTKLYAKCQFQDDFWNRWIKKKCPHP